MYDVKGWCFVLQQRGAHLMWVLDVHKNNKNDTRHCSYTGTLGHSVSHVNQQHTQACAHRSRGRGLGWWISGDTVCCADGWVELALVLCRACSRHRELGGHRLGTEWRGGSVSWRTHCVQAAMMMWMF